MRTLKGATDYEGMHDVKSLDLTNRALVGP